MPSVWEPHPSRSEWIERVDQALKIIDLIDAVEQKFTEPMFICDVKTEHFGIDEDDKMKILDSDSVFLASKAGDHVS